VNATETGINKDEIARRAYEIWESRGCPPGDGRDNWDAALAELLSARRKEQNGTDGGLKVWLSRVRRKITRRNGG
jgi:Protein of unknown function (DUF2934)